MRYTIDFETRSRVKLKVAGAWRYAQDPSTEIICLGWKPHGGKRHIWVPGIRDPQELLAAVEAGEEISSFSAIFERAMWTEKLVPLGWPPLQIMQQLDPQAVCSYKALPRSLEDVGLALELPIQKNPRGHYLIQRLCKPRRPSKNDKREYFDDQAEYEEFYDYCLDDCSSEECLSIDVGDLPAPELAIWRLDQTINDRGVKYDRQAVNYAMRMLSTAEDTMLGRFKEIVGDGLLEKPTQRDKYLEWLHTQGARLPDLTEDTIDLWLNPHAQTDMSDGARETLQIRQQIARSSTKKLVTMRAVACRDDRMRGLLQYHGAMPGRWAGRLVQPQNFPRPIDTKTDALQVLRDVLRLEGDLDTFEMLYGPVHAQIADVLRSFLIPDKGRVFCAADYSSIESRVLMWLAGQIDALELLGSGHSLYIDLAQKIFGRPIDKHEDLAEYTVGKVGILGLGYQMSGGRLYDDNKDNPALADNWTLELAEDTKTLYRKEYDQVPRLWRAMEEAAIEAVLHPDRSFGYGHIEFQMVDRWLTMLLPSGKRLWYFDPHVREASLPWSTAEKPAYAPKLFYWAYKEGQWRRVSTYGGKLTQNACEGVARALLVASMPKAEAAGYPIVLTIHDDLWTEPHEGGADHKVLEQIMEDKEPWARDIPVAAEGWTAERGRK